MSNSNQEIQHGGGFSAPVPSDEQNNNAAGAEAPINSTQHCTRCGSLKRRSPSSSSLQEPTLKNFTHLPFPISSTAAGDQLLPGFTKLSLAFTSPNASKPALRRCDSEPINSLGINNIGTSNTNYSSSSAASGSLFNPQSPQPQHFKFNVPAKSPSPAKEKSPSLPPLPPTLCRTFSDPTPSAYEITTTTPPRMPGARASLQSLEFAEMRTDSIKAESPTSKKLKRMTDIIKEMSERYDDVMREGEEDDGSQDDTNDNSKDEPKTENEETVWVDRTGECLIVHFKCPCGKGYQILLSGTNCYYKLM